MSIHVSHFLCVAIRCSVVAVWLQCGCSVLQCVAVHACRYMSRTICVLQFVAVWLQYGCSVVAVWLQCVNLDTYLARENILCWSLLHRALYKVDCTTNHRALLRKTTYKDKASYGSPSPCSSAISFIERSMK